jgi:hypothetical protein
MADWPLLYPRKKAVHTVSPMPVVGIDRCGATPYWPFLSFAFLVCDHLALAAFRALALRSSGPSLAALVFPPLDPPIFPNATACGFFSFIGPTYARTS